MRRELEAVKRMLLIKSSGALVTNPDIVLLGDSNTAISFFGTVPEKRWGSIVSTNLGAKVVNMGVDGRSTFDFIRPDTFDGTDRKAMLIAYQAKYYIICFGLNDEKYITTSQFDTDTRELINVIQTQTTGVPILMTNVKVDYPAHYSSDRNATKIKPFDDVKRTIATELGLSLIDVYNRFDAEITAGNWDHRIRTTSIWDASQDADKTVGAPDYWWNNIHYNIEGNRIVADEITNYFQINGLVI